MDLSIITDLEEERDQLRTRIAELEKAVSEGQLGCCDEWKRTIIAERDRLKNRCAEILASLDRMFQDNSELEVRCHRLFDACEKIHDRICDCDADDEGWLYPAIYVDDFTVLKQALEAAETVLKRP